MKRNFQAGDNILEGIVILATIILIMVLLPKEGSPLGTEPGSFNSGWSSESNSNNSYVSLGSGNAAYAYQPYEEYITIENRGNSSVDITGWQLKNGKDKRESTQSNTLQRFSPNVAVLPSLVLDKGEKAIITTGSMRVQTPHKITNFRENMCTGYIEALPDYAFTPPLSLNCPNPVLEPGFALLDKECQNLISAIPSCQTPTVDKQISGSCRAFIQKHLNFDGCVAQHSNNQNYERKTWRIFLGRNSEMWANDYETIELFNSLGQLVDFRNY
ncbi:MAG: lamin tail domain-containing protein [Candidatus Zambryskibacteria bacterium]|nr:lamin tail domain-containing protein [Candidatus Zambryskibacteria bacterium]